VKSDKAIVFVVDNAYIDYLPVALLDVWWGSDGKYPIYLIFDLSMKVESVKKIERFASDKGIDLRLTVVPQSKVYRVDSNLITSRKTHVSATVYAKTLIADLLPHQIRFAYYFDIDILVMRRFTELFNVEPAKAIAAVDHNHEKECERLTGAPGAYFNTGVFIANLDVWREIKLSEKIEKIVETRSDDLLNLDQDALFLALHDNWQELPLIYNFYLMRFNPYLENYSGELDWNPDRIRPAIVHFAGPWKPWNGDRRANTFSTWRDRRKRL